MMIWKSTILTIQHFRSEDGLEIVLGIIGFLLGDQQNLVGTLLGLLKGGPKGPLGKPVAWA